MVGGLRFDCGLSPEGSILLLLPQPNQGKSTRSNQRKRKKNSTGKAKKLHIPESQLAGGAIAVAETSEALPSDRKSLGAN
jgi:hypothetical protein